MKDNTESQKWDTTMGALEANWATKITEGQDEYKSEYLSFYGIPPTTIENDPESE